MRLLELSLLLITSINSIVVIAVETHISTRWILTYAALFVALLHFVIEKKRWQMYPAYLGLAILFTVSVIEFILWQITQNVSSQALGT